MKTQTMFLVPDMYVSAHLNLQRCNDVRCGCSANSLRTLQGQGDRSVDFSQAGDRTRDNVQGDKRRTRLQQANNRYARLAGDMTYPIVGSVWG